MASAMRKACRTLASVAPTREPYRLPRSSVSVGRPVSLPRALAKALLPQPGGDRSRTPLGLTRWPGRQARKQKSFRLASRPSDSNRSWPRWSVKRLFFLRAWDLSSQMTSGRMVSCRVSDRAKAPSAS